MRSLQSNIKLADVKQRDKVILGSEEIEKCIEDYVKRVTAGARQRADGSEAAIRQEKKDMAIAGNVGLTTSEPEKTFPEIVVAIEHSLSNIAHSDHVEDENDQETVQRKLSEDDEPGCVMDTISKTVQQHVQRFRLKHMKLDELTQP